MTSSSLTRREIRKVDGGDESDFFAYGISFHQLQGSLGKNPCLSQVRGVKIRKEKHTPGDGEAPINNVSEAVP